MTWLEQPFPAICPAPALLEPLTVYALPGQPSTWLLTLTGPDQGALSYGGLNGTVYPVLRQDGELHVSLHGDRFLLMDESGQVNAGLLERLRAREADFLPLDMRFQSDVDGLDPPNECAWLLPTAEHPRVAVFKTRTLGYSFDEDGLYEVMLNLHVDKKARGMIREFPLYDMGERTLGTAL